MKQYCLHGFSGLVELRKTRQGPIVGVYNSKQGGVDEAEGGRWSTVCEGHSVSVNHSTLALARHHASDPQGWCERCGNGEPFDVDAPTIPYAKE